MLFVGMMTEHYHYLFTTLVSVRVRADATRAGAGGGTAPGAPGMETRLLKHKNGEKQVSFSLSGCN